MNEATSITRELQAKFRADLLAEQETHDNFPTLWVKKSRIVEVLQYLKYEVTQPYNFLYDLTAIDERMRKHRDGQPESDYTVLYHLLSYDRNEDLRLKVPLAEKEMSLPSATKIWPAASWYEREVWDMFGVKFDGHPNLRRILMPDTWQGHPLQKHHPARATEMGPYELPVEAEEVEHAALQFKPEEWGMKRSSEHADYLFLNLGPQHPGTHGVLRMILQMDGEEIVDSIPEIGFHHRGAEKMGERQTWHSFIPYTDRIDYLSGVMNNLVYVMAVEKLAGIEVPARVKTIRVMMCELFRIISHLVWYGTFAADIGAMSPVFFMFNDRERIFEIVEAVCGGRMHPSWFRIGGVAHDLPKGWERLVREFIAYFPKRLKEYDKVVMRNRLFQARTKGVGAYTKDEAVEWGVTGPGLRACGFEWDFRKKRPYSGYEQFEFDIPTAINGDCFDRASVRIAEMSQSLRIVKQCLENMPEGPYKSDHPLTTPPRKERTMQDIETLINHFLSVTWGPVISAGEVFMGIEGAKGNNGYYLISDGSSLSYRTRIRVPSYPHLQMVPEICRGTSIPDLMAILGSVDYVLADVDR